MKRIIVLFTVALVMAAMMLAMAMPAFAGVQGGENFGGFDNNGQGTGGRHIGSGAGGGDAHIDQGDQVATGGGTANNPHVP